MASDIPLVRSDAVVVRALAVLCSIAAADTSCRFQVRLTTHDAQAIISVHWRVCCNQMTSSIIVHQRATPKRTSKCRYQLQAPGLDSLYPISRGCSPYRQPTA
ncbi:hypothetical protein J3F83DRAFT_533217 [Trichoderma novae-zelandiae]